MNETVFNNLDVSRLLDAIRDPIRMQIILLLGHGQALNVGDITTRFRISRPAISHHLKVLKDAGIVQNEKNGQEVYYHLNCNCLIVGLRQIADSIENCCTRTTSEGK